MLLDIKLRLSSMGITLKKIKLLTDATVVTHQLKNPFKAEVHSRLMAITTAQTIEDLQAEVSHVDTNLQKADSLTKWKK